MLKDLWIAVWVADTTKKSTANDKGRSPGILKNVSRVGCTVNDFVG